MPSALCRPRPPITDPVPAMGRDRCSGAAFTAFHAFHMPPAKFQVAKFSPFRADFKRMGERFRGQSLSDRCRPILIARRLSSSMRSFRFSSREHGPCFIRRMPAERLMRAMLVVGVA